MSAVFKALKNYETLKNKEQGHTQIPNNSKYIIAQVLEYFRHENLFQIL